MDLPMKLLTRWMLQQRDLLFACSQPCIDQLDTVADGLAGVAGTPLVLFRWML